MVALLNVDKIRVILKFSNSNRQIPFVNILIHVDCILNHTVLKVQILSFFELAFQDSDLNFGSVVVGARVSSDIQN